MCASLVDCVSFRCVLNVVASLWIGNVYGLNVCSCLFVQSFIAIIPNRLKYTISICIHIYIQLTTVVCGDSSVQNLVYRVACESVVGLASSPRHVS